MPDPRDLPGVLWDALAEHGYVDGWGGAEWRRVVEGSAWTTLVAAANAVVVSANISPEGESENG